MLRTRDLATQRLDPAADVLGGSRSVTLVRAPAELLVVPFLVLFTLIFLVPIAFLIIQSFRVDGGLSTANYEAIVLTSTSRQILIDTAVVTFAVTASCVVIGFALALTISQARPLLRAVLLLAVIAPFFVTVTVRIFGWLALSSPPSPLAYVFDFFLPGTSLRNIGLPLAVLALIQIFLPFSVLPTLASVARIEPSLTRSARSLGARKGRILRKIILPLAVPGVITGAVLVFAQTISSFFVPAILGGGFLVLLPNVVVNNISFYYEPNQAAAAATLLGVTSLVVIGIGTSMIRSRAGIYRGAKSFDGGAA